MRALVIPLALACAGTQVAPGSALLARLLALGIHGGDHAHAVALVADQGHLHLVLSHVERGDHAHGGGPHHDHRQTSPSETDHVLHIAGDEAANTTPRRADIPPASAVAVAALPSPVPVWVVRPSHEPHARSSDPLRAVVLRL
jgi:uncharacterized protein involved in copper resistance